MIQALPNHPLQRPDCVYWTDGDRDVPVFQQPYEFDQLLAIYDRMQPKRVLEIGTYFGGTLKQWIAHAPSGAEIVCIDLPVPNSGAYQPDMWHGWAHTAGVLLTVLVGDSRDAPVAREAEKRGPYDFLFIDGDHHYETARHDYETYAPMVRSGGLVVFHDLLSSPVHPEIQVERLWEEIKAIHPHTTEEIHGGAWWGGIGILHMEGA